MPFGDAKAAEYDAYQREIMNTLVLVSCLLRNIFYVFPRLSQSAVVPMFDYDESPAEAIKMKVLLDLFVHNRYMHLHNEYITDLFSDEPPKGTFIAKKFMGYRFKVNDFVGVAQEAINSVTIKDLATKLRSGMARLTVDTPHHEMVFLFQNVASFSELLAALLPLGKDALMAMVYPQSGFPKRWFRLLVVARCSGPFYSRAASQDGISRRPWQEDHGRQREGPIQIRHRR